MSDSESDSTLDGELHAAITAGDLPKLRESVLAGEFVLLSTSKSDEDEDENMGALTAEIDEFEVLVAFTSEANAELFVREMGELFSDDESVDGVVVEGQAMLDYLPDGYGLLIDPEMENTSVLDPKMTAAVMGQGS
ncbi:MAG: SseB family protein [Rubripirellula sp.]